MPSLTSISSLGSMKTNAVPESTSKPYKQAYRVSKIGRDTTHSTIDTFLWLCSLTDNPRARSISMARLLPLLSSKICRRMSGVRLIWNWLGL